jgi:capsular exopolysaccharide synthesis family protein
MVKKHLRFGVTFAFAVVILVSLGTFASRPTYEPTASLEVDPPGSDLFSLGDRPNTSPTDPDYLETQAAILKSNELGLAVVRDLRLDENAEFADRKPLGGIVGVVTTVWRQLMSPRGGRNNDDMTKVPSEEDSERHLSDAEKAALRNLEGRLTVSAVKNSRIVQIRFAGYRPRLAARVANKLIDLFMEQSDQNRYQTAAQASDWLSQELDHLQQNVANSNRALATFQNANGILDVDDKQNTFTQKIGELNHQLTQTQIDGFLLQSYLDSVKTGNTDSLPQLRDNHVYQALLQRYSESRAQLAQASAIYGKNHPTVKKLRSEVDDLETQRDGAIRELGTQIQAGYTSARTREALVAKELQDMKGRAGNMNQKLAQYDFLKREAKADQDLYNNMYARVKEAAISARLRSSNIRVVERAQVLDSPTRPHRLANIMIALIIGIFGGATLAVLKGKLNDSISPGDVKMLTGTPCVALVPLIPTAEACKGARWWLKTMRLLEKRSNNEDNSVPAFFLDRPRSPEAEAMRSLQARIMLPQPDRYHQVVLVVSSSPGEGKSTIAVNLALALAQQGTTCLVDADLRKPTVTRTFGMSPFAGLIQALEGATLDEVVFKIPTPPGVSILPAGHTISDTGQPVRLWAMQTVLQTLRSTFTYIVIDSPPIIPYADARGLAPLVDGVILVGRYGLTTRQQLLLTTEILDAIHAPFLGVVLNGVDFGEPDYRYYQGRGAI